METRANYILIGAFTLLSLIMAAIFAVWIANAGLDKSYAVYDVKFNGPVRGVELGGEVRFNGIKVGEVTKLGLDKTDPSSVVARIRVLSDTPVKTDSVAQLEPAGLTGLAYIQILAGSKSAGPLVKLAGQERPVITTRYGQLDRLFQGGQGVVDTSIETLNRMKMLLDDQNLRNFALTLENTRRASELISARGALLDKTNEAANNINKAGIEVSRLAQTLSQATKSSSESFNTAAGTYSQLGQSLIEQTGTISKKANSILDDGQFLVKDLRVLTSDTRNSLKEFDKTNFQLRDATLEIKNAANGVNKASASVDDFFRIGSNETLPDLSAAAKGIAKTGDSVDTLVQDLNQSPSGLLAKAPSKKVRWKK